MQIPTIEFVHAVDCSLRIVQRISSVLRFFSNKDSFECMLTGSTSESGVLAVLVHTSVPFGIASLAKRMDSPQNDEDEVVGSRDYSCNTASRMSLFLIGCRRKLPSGFSQV
jgi:hypothetical protein